LLVVVEVVERTPAVVEVQVDLELVVDLQYLLGLILLLLVVVGVQDLSPVAKEVTE
jgi:hypothetical protein